LINIKSNNENKYLNKFYTTNNIVESINSKLNYYLPKKSTNNIDFLNSITKLLSNSILNEKNIIRHDYVTRSILLLIEDLNFNDSLKWINYDDLNSYLRKVINKFEKNLNQNEVQNYLNMINDLDNTDTNNELNNTQKNNIVIEENENSEEDPKNKIYEENNSEGKNEEEYFYFEEDKSIDMLINNLKINDNSAENEENINVDISDNEDNKDKEFLFDKKKFYKLPLKDRITIRNIFEKGENKKPKKRKKCYPLDDSDEISSKDDNSKFKKKGWIK